LAPPDRHGGKALAESCLALIEPNPRPRPFVGQRSCGSEVGPQAFASPLYAATFKRAARHDRPPDAAARLGKVSELAAGPDEQCLAADARRRCRPDRVGVRCPGADRVLHAAGRPASCRAQWRWPIFMRMRRAASIRSSIRESWRSFTASSFRNFSLAGGRGRWALERRCRLAPRGRLSHSLDRAAHHLRNV